ncbi:meiosis arrest female protein 1 [Phtheirospermum japonicum]|uniref:Meiosis arrest female protein 1 n=1 Tax=Phtheirospermum japonicum TaxID=374723 RepID=A0A830B866_9LAMI|nr:meiosis arrest female protein 1 [Phtheirospermum japonicum]
MRHISSSSIFTLSFFTTKNHKIFQKSHYLTFYTQTLQNPLPGHHHPRRQEDDGRRIVPVSVWWDFENCNLPPNTNVFRVGQCITNAVRANRINGPIQITAFGDVMQIPRTNQEAISSTGITLIHVPSGGKNSADRSLLLDLMYWVSKNPPPAHLFLISGDRDFACILHRLRMNNYNILLASLDSAPSVLCSAATIMWQWSSLLKGENLTGKLFNQPPDGHFNSWYGHFKAPLEDPYAVSFEQSSHCVNSDDLVEQGPDSKIRRIPKAVTKRICQILNSNPEGVSITQLRSDLSKSNLTIDKDLYGYRKFSRFLLAMPRVLKLHSGNDGQFIVRRAGSKYLDESDGESSSSEDVSEKTTPPPVLEPKVKAQSTKLVEARKEEKQNEFFSPLTKTRAQATNLQDVKKEEKRREIITAKRKTQEIRARDRKEKIPEKVEIGEIEDSSEKNENEMLVVSSRGSDSEFGIIRRIWMKLFRSGDANSSHENVEKDIITEEKTMNCNKSSEFVRPALFSPSSHEGLIYGKNAGTGDDVTADVSIQDTSFLNRIMGWFKFSSSDEIDNKVEKNGEKTDIAKVNNSSQLEIFTRESFWKELESFIATPQGSAIFYQSLTREHLAQNLQKLGSQSLKSLSTPELLHLVNLLISDKKWVEECKPRAFPFTVTHLVAVNNNNLPLNPNSNGLSQIFSGKQPEFGERKHQNPPYTGVTQPVHRNSSSKTRSELLADCQKLVDHIVKEYPDGFNLGSFRKLFLEKNGYALDLQKLGYEKLVNLLQIMPRARIEANLIFPAGAFKNPDSLTRGDDNDSSWDELGPVDDSGREKEKKNNVILTRNDKRAGKQAAKLPEHDYQPVLSDDFSDSEDEILENRVNKSKPEEESSLLQILDSLYTNKGCDGRKDESMGIKVTDKPEVVPQPPSNVGSGTKNETPVVDPARKHKPGKSYTFVSEEQDVDSKDRLVEGIMDSLKKSGERSIDSRILG